MRTDRITALIIASILLTASSAWITHLAILNSRKSIDLVFHTYKILGYAADLVALLKDTEINRLSIFNDGDESLHLQLKTKNRTEAILDTLGVLVVNKTQKQLLTSQIQPLVRARMDESFKPVTRRNVRIEASDSLTVSINRFIHYEEQLLSERLNEVDSALSFQNTFRFVSLFFIGITSFLALITIWKKQKKNDALIQQLNDSNQSLDKKVKERTRELQDRNEHTTELNKRLEQTLSEVQTFYDALQIRHDKASDTFREINNLYNNAPCGYHSLDQNSVIVRINDRELSWLGYTREEVMGKLSFRDIIAPDEVRLFNENFKTFLNKGIVRDAEYNFLRKDGSTFQGLLNATAIFDEAGNYKMSNAVIVDISAIKGMEAQIRDTNNKLRKLNEDKDSLLGVVAHDLKSPLNGIIGLINLLKSSLSSLGPEQQEYLRYIEHSCINMSALINNLLDIGKIESGLQEFSPERIELGVLLKQHIKIFEGQAERKRITIILEDNAPSVILNTDPRVLTRIMENLISNAIKFSPYQKKILIRVIHNASHVKIEVKDQGPGIAKEELPDLFKKYQRLSARPTGGESSTGLGLSIVKELVSYLAGKISVESDRNAGATFVLELPCTEDIRSEKTDW